MYARTIAAVSLACALLGSSLPAQAQPMPTYDPDGRYSGGQTSGRRYEFFGGMSYASSIRRETVTAPGNYAPGTIIINTAGAAALSRVRTTARRCATASASAASASPGTAPRGHREEGMAGLDAAGADAQAPARPAAPHGRRRRTIRSARARCISAASLYRIHGSNEPETIGQAVSSGCFRLTNDDVIDLYNRVRVGTTVIVQ